MTNDNKVSFGKNTNSSIPVRQNGQEIGRIVKDKDRLGATIWVFHCDGDAFGRKTMYSNYKLKTLKEFVSKKQSRPPVQNISSEERESLNKMFSDMGFGGKG